MKILDYIVDQEIHQSRVSTCYRAHDEERGRPVVLKILKEAYPPPHKIARFRREFEILQQLGELSGVVEGIRLATDDNRWVMVVEDFGATSLDRTHRGTPMQIEAFLELAQSLAASLGGVHANDVMHKDITLGNIVLNAETKTAKIIDFGISTVLSREKATLRNPSVIEGTLPYMSPEQTGRMNRSIDYRTDLYSLGVVFYELLTGRLPFDTSDPMELVHCHIAKPPRRPTDVIATIPEVVSDVVMKLMAKNAEDRYQSAESLEADLAHCLEALRTRGRIEGFELDTARRSARFELPQKLYGRDRQIARLLETFEALHDLQPRITLVSGYSGIGKSSLVQEIFGPVTARRGYFCEGKFDQLQRDTPYESVVQAFRSLLQQILTESEARIAGWREALLSALGANAQVMIDVISDLELIIGPQPPVAHLPAVEAQNRFNQVLRQFVRVFAQPEHPLVLFLDDLQWVDPASLSFIRRLMLDDGAGCLLIIGAFRDNEVSPSHPLMLTLDDVRKAGAPVEDIVLAPLAREDVEAFLADTLSCERSDIEALASLVIQKTDGNPFFMREFLKALYIEGLIERGPAGGRAWQWSLRDIESRSISDNVVELLAQKLRQLDDVAQRELTLASIIGNRFDLATLATVSEKSKKETAAALWPALTDGLLIALDDNYKLIALDVEGLAEDLHVTYRFAHDRIQQAAYSLLPEEERAAVHWKIGRLLLDGTDPDERDRRIFDIANHLNQGRALATGAEARDELAALNLTAAAKAMESAAFDSANELTQIGIELLGDDGFERDYALALELHEVAAESAFITGQFEQMDERIDAVQQHARDLLDTVRVTEVKVLALNAQEDPAGAVQTALDLTEKLGVSVPRDPSTPQVLLLLARAKWALRGKSIDDLAAAPDMTDERKLAALRIICLIYSSTYVYSPLTFAASVLTQVRIVGQHGNSGVSCLVYVVYGALLGGILGDIKGSYAYGKLAQRLLEHPDAGAVRAQAMHTIPCLTLLWGEPLRAVANKALEAFQVGVETGELEYACYAGHTGTEYMFLSGADLHETRELMDTFAEAMVRYKQDIPSNVHASWRQAVTNLSRPTATPAMLIGDAYDERVMLDKHRESGVVMELANAFVAKVLIAYLFGESERAAEMADEGEAYLETVQSQAAVAVFPFYASLARLDASTTARDPKRLLGRVARDQKKLKTFADAAPMNYLHKYVLVEAERARVRGEPHVAQELYDRAIALARQNDFLNEEALALELAGRFLAARGRDDSARHYLQDARYAYLRWGAVTKVADLDARYPRYLAQERAGRKQKRVSISHTATTTTTAGAPGGALDLTTVLKASQAISGEVVLSELLRRMMRIVIENAGAERGVLLLERDGEMRIEAEGRVDREDIEVLQSAPLDGDEAVPAVPTTVIRLATRTRLAIVLDDAVSDHRFGNDPYVLARRPKSVLCQPIVHQGTLFGVLYLENSLATGAFNQERIEVLDLLSGQIAVSIQNATLYETLEERVRERTEQLEVRNRFIRSAFGRYLSDEVVDSLLETPEGLKLGGESRAVSILMSDLRGFTSMSEALPPEDVISILNNYLSQMTEVILKYQGTIDEFIGDAILVVFGAPLWKPDHADRAVACALEMQRALRQVNAENAQAGLPEVSMGIGVHTGQAVIGNIGSAKRAKYGVVGRTVNLAGRVEGYTVGGQVLISEATRDAVDGEVGIISELDVFPKGVQKALRLYDVGSVSGRYEVSLEREEQLLELLGAPVPVQFRRLEGKDVVAETESGTLVRIGPAAAELRHVSKLPPLTDLAIRIVGQDDDTASIYAKVLPLPADEGCSRLGITSFPDDSRRLLEQLQGDA